jgi:hypothetical protein
MNSNLNDLQLVLYLCAVELRNRCIDTFGILKLSNDEGIEYD